MNKRIIFSLAVLFIVVSLKSCDKDIKRIDVRMIISAESPVVIYSNPGSYVAFCDAIKFEGKYYCVFREGENHAPYHDYHENALVPAFCEAWCRHHATDSSKRDGTRSGASHVSGAGSTPA